MYRGRIIALIIPARNEARALPSVLGAIPPCIDHVVVADNGSQDETPAVAHSLGAIVVREPTAGYGSACQAACRIMEEIGPDIVAFADGDGSDDVGAITRLIDPIVDGHADFALEHRIPVESAAMTFVQRFGNRLVTTLIRGVWGYRYHDLGPMRVLTWGALKRLDMRDHGYGWTVEMQIKALKHGLRICELAMPYRCRRAGKSKVSGSPGGVIRAGLAMIWVILREALTRRDTRISQLPISYR